MINHKFNRILSLTVTFILIFTTCVFTFVTPVQASTSININGSVEGRAFEGIAAVSAGAQTKLLYDYPSVYQSQILDYLFKPKYGAGFQSLKVEIGSDVNSTCGSEPSHARTRDEYNNPTAEMYNRGYEWWFMKEAKSRNSNILLDCLEWGAPSWVADTNYTDGIRWYSQDNINYMIQFIKGAKTYQNLDIGSVGIWNERTRYDTIGINFIKNLRTSLNSNGLSNVKITATDETVGTRWYLADYMANDPVLKDAVSAIGVHYPSCETNGNAGRNLYQDNSTAQALGTSLYASEDGPWGGTWTEAKAMARLINKNYINNKITKTEIWSPVSSSYDIQAYPSAGCMLAWEPWSGHYEVQPSIWAVAHTTQFAEPGWKYIDSGCGLLNSGNSGSYVTLKKPDGSGNYSVIIETIDSSVNQDLTFNLSNLSTGTLHVWKSDSVNQFVQQTDITPSGGSFTITVAPGCIYSLTTTTGQTKGNAGTPPESQIFPRTVFDNFENYDIGKTPKYFADIVGGFEVYKANGETNTLRQVVSDKGICWMDDLEPVTLMGNKSLSDYEVSTDVLVENSGTASIYGHVTSTDFGEHQPYGYKLSLNTNGNWSLTKAVSGGQGVTTINTLASGTVSFSADSWTNLKLNFFGSKIKAYLGGNLVATVTDTSYSYGMAGLGTGWNKARFDNFSIKSENLAIQHTATASSEYSSDYSATKSTDADFTSRWSANSGNAGEWLQVDLGTDVQFDSTNISEYWNNAITGYKLQYWNGTVWNDILTGTTIGTSKQDSFTPVVGSKVRLYITGTSGGYPSIFEFKVYDTSGNKGVPPTNLVVKKSISASSQWSSDYGANNASDGNLGTRWNGANGTGNGEWLQVDFGKNTTFNKTQISQTMNRITGYKIQYWDGSNWQDAYTGGTMGTSAKTDTFTSVVGSKVRLYVTSTQSDGGYTCPSISEFEVYDTSSSLVTSQSLSGAIRNDYSDYVGTKITVGSSAITVSKLGRYFIPNNTGTHTIKIVRASDGVELASADINMIDGYSDSLGFKYVQLSRAVTLTANTSYYIVSLESSGGDQFYNYSGNSITPTSAASIDKAVYKSGSSWIEAGNTGEGYGPVNMKY